MQLKDTFGAITSISVPGFPEALPVGVDLPDGLDLSKLQETIAEFYGDRILLTNPEPAPQPEPPTEPTTPKSDTVKPARKRR